MISTSNKLNPPRNLLASVSCKKCGLFHHFPPKVKKKTASPTTTVVKNPDYKESVDYGFTSFKEWRAQKSKDTEPVGEGITGDDDANERALDKNRAMAKKYGQVRQGIPPEDKEKKKAPPKTREWKDKENAWRRAQRANRKASGIVRQD